MKRKYTQSWIVFHKRSNKDNNLRLSLASIVYGVSIENSCLVSPQCDRKRRIANFVYKQQNQNGVVNIRDIGVIASIYASAVQKSMKCNSSELTLHRISVSSSLNYQYFLT